MDRDEIIQGLEDAVHTILSWDRGENEIFSVSLVIDQIHYAIEFLMKESEHG